MSALKIIALIVGASFIGCGTAMFVLSRLFGSGGLFDRYRRDKSSEAFFIAIVVIGASLIGWGAFA